MDILKIAVLSLGLCCAGGLIQAKGPEASQHHTSKYAGQENRAVKSLSSADITELRNGSGWGLAKAAELNGVPGPAHLLELQDEIGLNAEQIERIQHLYDQMKAEAIVIGQQLIKQEESLEDRFRSDLPEANELKTLLDEIGATRSRLRFVHLSTHLQTPAILSGKQIKTYNRLRGYASENPCDNIPAGHSPEMWKRHNRCD